MYQEYSQIMRSAEMVSPLSSDLFGENINLFDGQTEFSNIDINVPGNSELPVQLRRRLSIVRATDSLDPIYGGIGEWDIDVPQMSGVFQDGDIWGGGTSPRCTSLYGPIIAPPFEREIFRGVSVHIPGKGDSEVLLLTDSGSSIFPNDGASHIWTTRNFDAFTCTPGLANSADFPGQGFVMKSTDGLTYTFNWMTTRSLGTLVLGPDSRDRTRVYLLATRIEDRYGNHVDYSYNDRGLPDFIRGYIAGSSTPERQISLQYTGTNADTRLSSATAHGRTWDYQYDGGLTVLQPASADIPEAQRPRWSYASSGSVSIPPQEWDGNRCAGAPEDEGEFTLEITHPAGAKGTFEFGYKRLGRSGILSSRGCSSTAPDQKILIPNFADGFALIRKTITGPGLSPMEWLYDAGGGGVEPFCDISPMQDTCATATLDRTVTVTEPDLSQKRYRFGIKFEVNHGRLLGTQTKAADGSPLSTTATSYYPTAPPANSFPDLYGYGQGGSDDINTLQIRPIISETQTRQGITFSRTTDTTDFDGYARPLKVMRYSTMQITNGPNSRTETTFYKDDTTRWLLGSIESVTESTSNKVMQYNSYDITTLDRISETRFGKLERTMHYNADGTLDWVRDGLNQQTTLSDYKRGIPRRIEYADTKFQTAEVNDQGQITAVTNEVGSKTDYLYREDGRLKQIDYPVDTPNWNSTTLSFVPAASPDCAGLATCWRQQISTGNARRTTLFDGRHSGDSRQ